MKSPKPKKDQQPSLPEIIRSERNIEKWSIWVPANSRTELKERVFERAVELPDGGKAIGRLTVAPTTKGNLTTEDQRVYYALVRIWEERGRPETFTPVSLRHIAKVLRRKWHN